MDVTQTNNSLVIYNKNNYAFAACIGGAVIGFLIFAAWLISFISSTDFLAVDALTGIIGVFFLVGCSFGLLAQDVRRTEFVHDGQCTITTIRRLTRKAFVKSFTPQDVTKIEFVDGYSDTSIGNVSRSSSVYAVFSNGEKIEILFQYAIKPFSFPFKSNTPLNEDANLVAEFLQVPLETVDITSLKSGIKNFNKAITPHSTTSHELCFSHLNKIPQRN